MAYAAMTSLFFVRTSQFLLTLDTIATYPNRTLVHATFIQIRAQRKENLKSISNYLRTINNSSFA